VFHDAAAYEAFLELIAAATARLPMRVLGWCLIPNHFHLVIQPSRRIDGYSEVGVEPPFTHLA
jgi:putative transposase